MHDPTHLQILFENIKQFPSNTKQQTLEIYITYVLRSEDLDDIHLFCQNLLAKEDVTPGYISSMTLEAALNDEINNIEKFNRRFSKKLDLILSDFGCTTDRVEEEDAYTKLNQLNAMIDELRLNLTAILGKTRLDRVPEICELLSQIEHETKHRDNAMRDAMKTLFDRLFDAMNPDDVENHLEQSHLLIGPLKKSALFEATKEKYQQLQAYHQSGHFVRDFKVTYKQNLRTKFHRDK